MSAGSVEPEPGGVVPPPPPTKTPFYQASNADRYQRQALIRQIEGRSKRKLICYVSGSLCAIDREDTVPFADLLHNIQEGTDVDLLLHTGGGNIDVAEKLISMVRNRVGDAVLRAIVPDFAKSAGTLMVLGTDRVLMSDTSELGPIDPQIVLADSNGNRMRHSVQNHLDAFKTHTDALKDNPNDVAAQIMLGKLDPATIELYQGARVRSQQVAEQLIRRGMFRTTGNYSATVSELLNTKRWKSHDQMISWADATEPRLGLVADFIDPRSDEWQEIWQLYCLQRLSITDRQKLFESDFVSLVVGGANY